MCVCFLACFQIKHALSRGDINGQRESNFHNHSLSLLVLYLQTSAVLYLLTLIHSSRLPSISGLFHTCHLFHSPRLSYSFISFTPEAFALSFSSLHRLPAVYDKHLLPNAVTFCMPSKDLCSNCVHSREAMPFTHKSLPKHTYSQCHR